MKEQNAKAVMRCKHCGHEQDTALPICESCGYDMGLYGEVVRPSSRPALRPFQPGKGILVFIAAVLLVVVVVVVILSGKDPEIELGAETTEATTQPTETEKPTETTVPATTIPEETEPEETTEQTEPNADVQIVEFTLDCFDLLYDIHDGTQVSWVPQGYFIGYDLSVVYTGEKNSEFVCKVTSSDESVLRVDEEKYNIYAYGPGTATITATMDGYMDSQEITVYPVDASRGSNLSLNPEEIVISGTEPVDVTATITMIFGEEIDVMTTKVLAGPGVTGHTSGEWTKVGKRTYSREMTFTIDPTQLSTKTDKGFLFYMMVKDGDDVYNLDRDILGFSVVTIKNSN